MGDIINEAAQGGTLGTIVDAMTRRKKKAADDEEIEDEELVDGDQDAETAEEEVDSEGEENDDEATEDEAECDGESEEGEEEDVAPEDADGSGKSGGFGSVLGSILSGGNLGNLAKGVISIIGLAGSAFGKRKG